MIVGSHADSVWNSEFVVKNTAGPAELYTIDGATHVSLYDDQEQVAHATRKLTQFYTETLN